MEAPLNADSGDEMYANDIFEGWLSIPSIQSFLEQTPQSRVNHSNDLDSSPQMQEQDHGSNPSNSFDRNCPSSSLTMTRQSSKDTPASDSAIRKRRGHTKSRLGCQGCKRRRIKCQETWPSCANCIKRGCPCRYPTVPTHTQQDRDALVALNNSRSIVQVSETPKSPTYSANDMRLFHHFLIVAHPTIPQEAEHVWTRDVPAFSHQYEYLMHGILATAASHLDIFNDGPSTNKALAYRQKAITGLEKALTKWPPQPHDAHAMLATSYLLAFQSAYMPDGFQDHILALRGCASISQMILNHRLEGAFTVDCTMDGSWFEWRLINFPVLDQQLARDALHSLAELAPQLCTPRAHEIERTIIAQLAESLIPLLTPLQKDDMFPPTSAENAEPLIIEAGNAAIASSASAVHLKNPLIASDLALQFDDITSWDTITDVPPDHKRDPQRSFNALMSSLLVLSTWPRDSVLHLFSPDNVLGHIVLAHFLCVRFIVSPLSAPESTMKIHIKGMVEWAERVLDAVEDDNEVKWTQYVEWPRKILTTLRCCVNQKNTMTFGDLYNIIMKEPEAFREGRAGRL